MNLYAPAQLEQTLSIVAMTFSFPQNTKVLFKVSMRILQGSTQKTENQESLTEPIQRILFFPNGRILPAACDLP